MRKISKEELSEILKQHKIWLESNYKSGSRADLSITKLSGADLSITKLSGADLSEANLYGANLEGADLSGANLSGADLSEANLSRADLEGADLSAANLFRTNLSGDNLSEANLEGAYIYGANLEGANLSGANLFETKGIAVFRYEKHLALAFNNNKYITIGCKQYRTKNWVKNFEKIGKDEDYSNSQIKMYGQFINMINEQSQGGK